MAQRQRIPRRHKGLLLAILAAMALILARPTSSAAPPAPLPYRILRPTIGPEMPTRPASQRSPTATPSALPKSQVAAKVPQEIVGRQVRGLAYQAYLEKLAEDKGLTAILMEDGFIPSDAGGALLYQAILDHLNRFHYTATALEDVPEARTMCAQLGLGTSCQFWHVGRLKLYGGPQVIYTVMEHESVHNVQAANDPQLAEHTRGDPQDPLLAVYRALIEGAAEDPAMGGCAVGGPSYQFYRQLYATLKKWAAQHERVDEFQRLCLGDFDELEPFLAAYNEAGGDWKVLLNRLYCLYYRLASYGRIEYQGACGR